VTKRQIVKNVIEGQPSPYVPWSCGFTVEAKEKLVCHYGDSNLEDALQNQPGYKG